MKLLLQRRVSGPESTVGQLYEGLPGGGLNGLCFTLEDVVRDHKIAGKTAIPAGTYRVVITPSARFKRPLPLLLDVPNYEGIRLHAGNTAADTSGCLLLGRQTDGTHVWGSRSACEAVQAKIQHALDAGETVEIEIRNGVAA